MNRILLSMLALLFSASVLSQANWNVTDPEKDYKKAKEYFMSGDYALAYPLLQPLLDKYPANTTTDHSYINQDVQYFFIATGLKLGYSESETQALDFIENASNEPRQQMMSFHLARYYFVRGDFARAVTYYQRAGYDNLSNEEIADAKFELAYSYFKLGSYDKAKPLFNEIHQLPDNKYFADANYYFGYISFKDGDYNQALSAFQQVEQDEKYHNRVSYYIAQIYYFRGDKDRAQQYGEKILTEGNVENRKDLNLLMGQIYFEKKQFAKALPLLEDYVKRSDKVSKEVMYELAYCYYDAGRSQEAIDAFKQLSNEQDSLGQNSMYLLADLYLKTGQKVNARNAFQYSADNNSNLFQQEVSRFNYAKLSYELGYNDIALSSINNFLARYPRSPYANEAKEIVINLLANSNNYADALNLYHSFKQPTPTMRKIYPRILFGRATELINGGQYAGADKLLDEIIDNPEPGTVLPYAYFWKGELAYREKQYLAAASNMNQYLRYGKTLGEASPVNARYTLGYAYLKMENYQQAYQYFNAVAPSVSSHSGSVAQDAYVRSADAQFMLKNYDAAKRMYRNIANLSFPQSDYSLYQIALIDGIDNQTGKIQAFNQLIRQYPESDLIPEAHMQIADAYMTQEKFADAVPYLQKILSMPKAASYYPETDLKLGLIYYNLNNNKEALHYYEELVNKYPQSSEAEEALSNMKNIYVEQGRPDDYIGFVKKSGKNLTVSEADSLTFVSARLQFNDNKCTAAIESFNNYLARYPQGSFRLEALFDRSECYRQSSSWENAVKGYTAVVAEGNSPYAEESAFHAARIFYLELEDYDSAKVYFSHLLSLATRQENQLEALRGLIRSYYQTKDFSEAHEAAAELLTKKGISTDDKAIANLVKGRALQMSGSYDEAIKSFKQVTAINKSAWGAEASYEIANSYFLLNNLKEAEKAGMDLIKTGGADYWVAKGYILLGDIYWKEKDYFNAKATFKSVADNATIQGLKEEAAEKYAKVLDEEKAESKIETEN